MINIISVSLSLTYIVNRASGTSIVQQTIESLKLKHGSESSTSSFTIYYDVYDIHMNMHEVASWGQHSVVCHWYAPTHSSC